MRPFENSNFAFCDELSDWGDSFEMEEDIDLGAVINEDE